MELMLQYQSVLAKEYKREKAERKLAKNRAEKARAKAKALAEKENTNQVS